MTILETTRFEIPLLAVGQAHKELFHNEALTRIDFLVHPVVQAIETDPAVVDPVVGKSWLVGPGATNEWLNHDDEIACWTGNGWLFVKPVTLMRIYVESIDNFAIYRGSWQLTEAVASPEAGAVVDAEARTAINSILAALEAQGVLKPGT